jgi:two-component system cell cycle response regulator DivK
MTKRILVVEDQEDLRGVLRDLLTGSGYNVAEAADGRDGVAKALSERPDLILMDIQLPGLDGYETTRQIRQIKSDPKLATTPIIAVSSFAMKGDEEKARAAGCDHYVTKPTARSSCCASSEAFSASKRGRRRAASSDMNSRRLIRSPRRRGRAAWAARRGPAPWLP